MVDMHFENLFVVIQAKKHLSNQQSKIVTSVDKKNVTDKNSHLNFNDKSHCQYIHSEPKRVPPGRARGHTRT